MTITSPLDPDLKLVKQLIELNGLSNAKAADAMGIQRSNLSSWLNGKPNVFSTRRIDGMLEALGMRAVSDPMSNLSLRYLSSAVAHRWQVVTGTESFSEVLRATEPASVLEGLEIFRVNGYPRGHFNIVRGDRPNGALVMLIAHQDPGTHGYPVSVEGLGFGRMVGTLELPLEQWIAWWREPSLAMPEFGAQLSEYLDKAKAEVASGNSPLNSQAKSVEAQLIDYQCGVAGFGALIQEFINELGGKDQKNRLLDKDVQRTIFQEAKERERQKRTSGS